MRGRQGKAWVDWMVRDTCPRTTAATPTRSTPTSSSRKYPHHRHAGGGVRRRHARAGAINAQQVEKMLALTPQPAPRRPPLFAVAIAGTASLTVSHPPRRPRRSIPINLPVPPAHHFRSLTIDRQPAPYRCRCDQQRPGARVRFGQLMRIEEPTRPAGGGAGADRQNSWETAARPPPRAGSAATEIHAPRRLIAHRRNWTKAGEPSTAPASACACGQEEAAHELASAGARGLRRLAAGHHLLQPLRAGRELRPLPGRLLRWLVDNPVE